MAQPFRPRVKRHAVLILRPRLRFVGAALFTLFVKGARGNYRSLPQPFISHDRAVRVAVTCSSPRFVGVRPFGLVLGASPAVPVEAPDFSPGNKTQENERGFSPGDVRLVAHVWLLTLRVGGGWPTLALAGSPCSAFERGGGWRNLSGRA